jgi:hypothetical protein
MATDRKEHLAWCKERALAYLDRGELEDAVASFMSDMNKHPDTKIPSMLGQLGMLELMSKNAAGVRRWIEGFN